MRIRLTRPAIACAVACAIAATAYAIAATAYAATPCPCGPNPAAAAQTKGDGPPCYATIDWTLLGQTSKVWNPDIFNLQGSWVYTWQWQVAFDCDNGPYSACGVCVRNQLLLYSPKSKLFLLQAILQPAEITGSCLTSTTATIETVVPAYAPLVAGQLWKVTFEVAPFSPQAGPECGNQKYGMLAIQTFTVPAPEEG